jgi:hypothetical protein
VSAGSGSDSGRSFPGERPRAGWRPGSGWRESPFERRAAEERRRPRPRDPKVRTNDVLPVGDVVAGLLSQRAFADGMRVGRLARTWPDVVGDRLAGECRPVRLEGGVLLVAASSGPWGAQVEFLAGEIRTAANRALGGEPVARVRVVVDDALHKG